MSEKVAIVCSTFNRAKQLERMVWSIANQDYPLDNVTLIIIDDGSIDETPFVITRAFNQYKNLSIIDIVTERKEYNHFGGQGLVLNLGFRYAEELEAEYVFTTGGDILWPSYALRKHLQAHKDVDYKADIIKRSRHLLGEFGGGIPTDLADIKQFILAEGIDLLLGPQIYFIRPDHESLGDDNEAINAVPDRYDWRPPEKLKEQPESLTLEEFPDREYIYLGYPGTLVVDISHPESPNLQSCLLKYWLELGGYDEAGTGMFFEDTQMRHRLLKYHEYQLKDNIRPVFVPVVHPDVESYHQPHPRQYSKDNHDLFIANIEKFGYNVNQGVDWGRSKHRVRRARV
jgi:glycosyltransferase involved in cell wall biosynthesis